VTWLMVLANARSEIPSTNYSSGIVLFLDGQLSADLTIDIFNNMKPALDTLYTVRLINVTQVLIYFIYKFI